MCLSPTRASAQHSRQLDPWKSRLNLKRSSHDLDNQTSNQPPFGPTKKHTALKFRPILAGDCKTRTSRPPPSLPSCPIQKIPAVTAFVPRHITHPSPPPPPPSVFLTYPLFQRSLEFKTRLDSPLTRPNAQRRGLPITSQLATPTSPAAGPLTDLRGVVHIFGRHPRPLPLPHKRKKTT